MIQNAKEQANEVTTLSELFVGDVLIDQFNNR